MTNEVKLQTNALPRSCYATPAPSPTPTLPVTKVTRTFCSIFFKSIAKSFFLPFYTTLKFSEMINLSFERSYDNSSVKFQVKNSEFFNNQLRASAIISVSGALSYATAIAFGVLAALGKALPKLLLNHLDKLGPVGFVLYGALALAALLLIIGSFVQAKQSYDNASYVSTYIAYKTPKINSKSISPSLSNSSSPVQGQTSNDKMLFSSRSKRDVIIRF